MIDDDHFETQADSGAVATQKNPKKERSGPLADVMCLADTCLIAGCRETNGRLASVRRLIDRLDSKGKKHGTVFLDWEYSLMPVIESIHASWVSVFGTAREFELHTNEHGPFIFRDNKDGPTILYKQHIKRNMSNNTTPQLHKHFVVVSGRGCALKVTAHALKENPHSSWTGK